VIEKKPRGARRYGAAAVGQSPAARLRLSPLAVVATYVEQLVGRLGDVDRDGFP